MRIRVHPGVASFLGALFVRLVGATWRVEWIGAERLEEARRLSPRIVFAFWHGRLFALSYSHRGSRVQVLASEHPDGDLMGRIIARLGFGHRRGSTTRGGAAAIRDLCGVLRDGFDVGLTVDGPRGPRGEVQQGAIEIARMTGSAVVPISNAARPRCLFRSWDAFQLPLPFARVVIGYGEPFVVPGDAGREEREESRLRLQDGLRELTRELDRSLGYVGRDVWPHEDR